MIKRHNQVDRRAKVLVSESARNDAVRLGLSNDPDTAVVDVQELVWFAGPITHFKGNRRYRDYIFKQEAKVIVSIYSVHCDACLDTKELPAFDVCEECNGGGCSRCNDTGEVSTTIRCQECI